MPGKDKPGVNPNIVFTFTSDWKATWTIDGEGVASGRFQLSSPETLIIDWGGKIETYNAIMPSGDNKMFTLSKRGNEKFELRKASK
jgi:hypothetical protein